MSSSAFTPSTNYANAATPSNEGLVNTGAQTFGGVKTFQDGAVSGILKAKDATGIEFKEDGGTTTGTISDVGSWTLGPAGAAAFTTLVGSGNLPNGVVQIAANACLTGAGATDARSDSTRAGGAIIINAPAGDTACIQFYANQDNDGVNVDADLVGSVTSLGAWILGPSGGSLLVGKSASGVANVGHELKSTGEFVVSSNTQNLNFYNSTAGFYRFFVSAAGTVNATSTSIVAISDISLKENVKDLETGLSQILALKPRRFDWKEETKIGEKNVAGFIAQEVEQVLPELVYDYKYSDKETKKSLKMGDILPTMVKAIQELKAELDEAKAKIAVLEAK